MYDGNIHLREEKIFTCQMKFFFRKWHVIMFSGNFNLLIILRKLSCAFIFAKGISKPPRKPISKHSLVLELKCFCVQLLSYSHTKDSIYHLMLINSITITRVKYVPYVPFHKRCCSIYYSILKNIIFSSFFAHFQRFDEDLDWRIRDTQNKWGWKIKPKFQS